MALLVQLDKIKSLVLKSAVLVIVTIALYGCSTEAPKMDEPPLDKIEFGFFNPIVTEYDCQLKRTITPANTPKGESKYKVLFIGFPDKKFDKGEEYLKTESYRIAMRIQDLLFVRLDTTYQEIEVGFHTNSQQHQSFVYQLDN